MGRVFCFIVSFFVFASLFSGPILAQRYVRCDVCGFCDYPDQIQPQALDGIGAELADKQPADLANCHKCLYPGIADPVGSRGTLLISETGASATGPIAPTPAGGRYYTMFGCIDTKMGGFSQEGASGAVVQQLLDVVFATVGGISFLTILFGSYVVLTSRADPNRLNYGRRVVVGAIIGLVFTLASVFIINTVGGKILGIPGF